MPNLATNYSNIVDRISTQMDQLTIFPFMIYALTRIYDLRVVLKSLSEKKLVSPT